MIALTPFGLFAVSAMLVCYVLESRSHWFMLLFAVSCTLEPAYGFLQGAWPFGLVEAVWSAVALRRCFRRACPFCERTLYSARTPCVCPVSCRCSARACRRICTDEAQNILPLYGRGQMCGRRSLIRARKAERSYVGSARGPSRAQLAGRLGAWPIRHCRRHGRRVRPRRRQATYRPPSLPGRKQAQVTSLPPSSASTGRGSSRGRWRAWRRP
jgi:hypothetical protein